MIDLFLVAEKWMMSVFIFVRVCLVIGLFSGKNATKINLIEFV